MPKRTNLLLLVSIPASITAVSTTASAEPPGARFDIKAPVFNCVSGLSLDNQIKEEIASAFKPFFPDVDVQSECASDHSDFRQQYGVWEHTGSAAEEDARRQQLQKLATIRVAKSNGEIEAFAASFGAALVQDAVNKKWSQTKNTPIQPPTVAPQSGFPGFVASEILLGQITLASKSPVTFTAPNQVGMQVFGSIKVDPWSFGWFSYDVNIHILDTISMNHETVQPTATCGANNQLVSCKTDGSYDIPALFGTKGTTSAVPSIGCPFAMGVPETVLLPGEGGSAPSKLVFNYDRVSSSSAGLAFGSGIVRCGRAPKLVLQGAVPVEIQKGQKTATATVAFSAVDLRPPFQVKVANEPAKKITTPGAVMNVTIPVPANYNFQQQVTDVVVTITVTDADNLTAKASTTVPLVSAVKAAEEQQIPCEKKPYLPNCK